MLSIFEFLAKKHLDQQNNRIKIAYLKSRDAYYVYLENGKNHETNDVKLFKTVIEQISDKYRKRIYYEFDECLDYYNNSNRYSDKIGLRFRTPFTSTSYISFTNYDNGELIDLLKIFNVSNKDLIDCIENDWEKIEKYIQ